MKPHLLRLMHFQRLLEFPAKQKKNFFNELLEKMATTPKCFKSSVHGTISSG